jgi:hypothetical protein
MSFDDQTRAMLTEIAQRAARSAAQQAGPSVDDLRKLLRETVAETLTSIGISTTDPIEMQKDFQHLREWRVSMENVQRKGILTAVGVVSTGLLAALWLGIKELINK